MSEKRANLKFDPSPRTIEYEKPHVPSAIQADTLFTFMLQLDFLLSIIKTAMIFPRYCEEDISYLAIEGFSKIAYPMKCFCDINMHRLEAHLSCYGHYGIAFSKEWGMRNKIQAVGASAPRKLCNAERDILRSLCCGADDNIASVSLTDHDRIPFFIRNQEGDIKDAHSMPSLEQVL